MEQEKSKCFGSVGSITSSENLQRKAVQYCSCGSLQRRLLRPAVFHAVKMENQFPFNQTLSRLTLKRRFIVPLLRKIFVLVIRFIVMSVFKRSVWTSNNFRLSKMVMKGIEIPAQSPDDEDLKNL